jgi:hypothetical protein
MPVPTGRGRGRQAALMSQEDDGGVLEVQRGLV